MYSVLVFAVCGMLSAQPAFEAASVKPGNYQATPFIHSEPGRFSATNSTLKSIVRYAFSVREEQISGGPGWFDSDRWDISATAGKEISEKERLEMLRTLLADRFQLKIHRETRELPVYALVIAKGGPKLARSKLDSQRVRISIKSGMFGMLGEGTTMQRMADVLVARLGRIVQDRTGMEGNFDWKLEFVPDAANLPSINGAKMGVNPDGPSIFTALQEQLGLKLESVKGPVEVLFVDKAMRATEN